MSNPEAIEGATEPSQNVSIEELIARRSQPQTDPEPQEESVEDNSWTDEEPEGELDDLPEASDDSDEDAEEDVESEEGGEIDLLDLSPEQIQALASKGKSRLLQRIGELTAHKRHLESQLAEQQALKPAAPAIPAEQNPFRSITTVDGLKAKYAELEQTASETDRILEDHEDYAADDIIVVGDKEFTKKDIRVANRNAREAMAKFIPAQHAEIVRIEQRSLMEKQLEQLIPQEIPEIADESSEVGKQYRAMLADPLVEQVKLHVPDLAPQLPYLLAHAARSLHRSQKLKSTAKAQGPTPRAKIPGNPVGAGAGRTMQKSTSAKANSAYKSFEQSHSVDDWVAARIAKYK